MLEIKLLERQGYWDVMKTWTRRLFVIITPTINV